MQSLNFDNMTTERVDAVLNLDQDEQELLASIENDNWVSTPDSKSEIKRFQDIAQRQVSIQKIELQMSIQDSDKIYSLANQLGLSVSNFAQDIIHKYLKGELVEKSN
jgi:predicted DNA binding CopG/RHH family protein